jgi:hypothetical protein
VSAKQYFCIVLLMILRSCSKGVRTDLSFCPTALTWQQFECKYSHDYLLTPDELGMLAASAKKAPCSFLKKGAYVHPCGCRQR